jgi:hypothetical protein
MSTAGIIRRSAGARSVSTVYDEVTLSAQPSYPDNNTESDNSFNITVIT